MEITIETKLPPLAFDLKENPPKGVSVTHTPITLSRSFGEQEVISVIISFAAGIPSSMLASWLFEKLKDKKHTKITIHRKEIRCEEGEIRRVIEEEVKIE